MIAFVFGRAYGCASLAVLVVDIVCILQIVESRRGTLAKALWIAAAVLFPFLGALAWVMFGKR